MLININGTNFVNGYRLNSERSILTSLSSTTTTLSSLTSLPSNVSPFNQQSQSSYLPCPEGLPNQWETQLDIASKAFLSPIVFNGRLIALKEDYNGRIAATFRVHKQIKNIGSRNGYVPVNLLPGTLVTLYFVRNKSRRYLPPYCAVYLNDTLINKLKTEQKYLVFAAAPLYSLVDLHKNQLQKQQQLNDDTNSNLRTTSSTHLNEPNLKHSLTTSKLYINYLSAFASPELHNKRSARAIRKILCSNCAKAPQVKGLNGDVRIESRSRLRLRCRVTGNPFPWIEWFRNGKRLKNKGRISIKNNKRMSILQIRRTHSSTDTGYYECRAMNVVAREPSIGRVRVIVMPSSYLSSSSSSLNNNNNNNRKYLNRNSSRTSFSSSSSSTLNKGTVTSTSITTVTRAPNGLWPMSGRPCPIPTFCLNGGTCTLYETVGEYVCQCAEGFRGQRCENKDIFTLFDSVPKDTWDYGVTSRMFQLYWMKETKNNK